MDVQAAWAAVVEAAGMLAGVPRTVWVWAGLTMVALFLLAATRRSPRPSRIMITLGTTVGLAWSAQGMWDVTVHRYGVAESLASVLFFMFEAFAIGAYMEAWHFRRDLKRRAPWVMVLWLNAAVMALVVAFGEGWGQAPLRLAVPLMLALYAYRQLTADDDPAERTPTSWRWPPREIGIRMGLLVAGRDDTRDINRERLRDAMTKLAFRERYGSQRWGDLTHRSLRLAKMRADATDEDLAEVDARLARSTRAFVWPDPDQPAQQTAQPPAPVAEETHPVMPPQPVEPVHVPAPEPTPGREPVTPEQEPEPEPQREERRPQGVHVIDGRALRGATLRTDAFERMFASVDDDHPNGMTIADLRSLYDPPLSQSTAEKLAAAARKEFAARSNGHAPVT